ncbi:hypothetical protein F66182_7222 [Fusarium sp. NRRL 66182]|nr:hypothetical protein F66182_7222 [Fusarium sp. NRRL 66182]
MSHKSAQKTLGQLLPRATRSYAAPRGPRAPPRQSPSAPKVAPPPPLTERYDINQITPQTFEDAIRANKGVFGNIPPEHYHKCATRFAKAIHNGQNPLSVDVYGEVAIPIQILYQMGYLLRAVPRSNVTQNFATAMWASASAAGHRLSTSLLSRDFKVSGTWGNAPAFKGLENRFRQLVAEGKDRDALTVEGEDLYKSGKYIAAAMMLEKALGLGDSGFFLKELCQMNLGRAYFKLGKIAQARELLEMMASSGDWISADADAELAQMLRPTDPDEAMQRMYSAALEGRDDMFQKLAEIAFEKEAHATDNKSKREHFLWGAEWSRLADSTVEY